MNPFRKLQMIQAGRCGYATSTEYFRQRNREIRYLHDQGHWTVETLAYMSDLSAVTIRNILRGKTL